MSEKITDKIAALGKDEPFFSFEFFPPKTEHGARNLYARLSRMSLMGPLFITVTWGAGGTTADKSLDLAETCQHDLGLTTCLHITCTNTTRSVIDNALEHAKKAGIRNILALRGDPSRNNQKISLKTTTGGDFSHAVDLVKYIREKYDDYFCIGVAGYPEGHADGFYDQAQDPRNDLPYLVDKINAGADFVLTQLFFDVQSYLSFEKMLRAAPGLKNRKIPVIPGLMPINNYGVFKRATKLAHASIPDAILDRFPPDIEADDDRVKSVGVDVIAEIIKQIYNGTGHATRGFHFYTLNLEKSIAQILEKSSVLGKAVANAPASKSSDPFGSAITDDTVASTDASMKRAAYASRFKQPQVDKVISISSGRGALGKDATWDDHPNGRFGDTRSPAYGSGYGNSLRVTPEKAYELWGKPETLDDLSKIFVNYLSRKVDAIPWSEFAISPETAIIQEPLIFLNKLHRFTMSSQPASNCARSDEKIFGWGPAHGYVYQKAYVEMFVSKEDWNKNILPKLKDNSSVSYYVGDSADYFSSSLGPQDTNCVTWGVFPNRQIVQTTVINEDSFKAWKEEGFQIWKEWMQLFAPGSKSAKLIKGVLDNYYLVAIVNHDYPDEDALWELLLGEQDDDF